jgi:hypothetical protein
MLQLNLESLDNKVIAINKAFIIGQRPKWRDYVDLFFILKGDYISLGEIVKYSLIKFGSAFSERLFLQQLVYWEDITDYKIEFIKNIVPPDEIKSCFHKEVTFYKQKELP